MSTVFIIHGSCGNPDENWIPWLKRELEMNGHKVIVPKFPTPEGQDLESWLKAFEQYQECVSIDSVFVGHSIGCAFILNILEHKKARAAYLVSGFTGLLGSSFDQINKTISNREFDWEAIKQNCPSLTIFHSDNDPYVPLDKTEELAQNLNTRITMISGAGHFNKAAGYLEFPELFEHVSLIHKIDIHKSGGVLIQGRKILVERSKGKDVFIAPGGSIEPGETAKQALVRELREEFVIGVQEHDLVEFGTFFAHAAGEEQKRVRMDVFLVKLWTGEVGQDHEVEEIRWIDSRDLKSLKIGSIIAHEVIPRLKEQGLID